MASSNSWTPPCPSSSAWQWHTHPQTQQTYLTCSLLADFAHGFFTRQAYPHTPAQLTQTLHPTASAYRTKQVHGHTVELSHALTPIAPETELPDLVHADSIVAIEADHAVWTCTADCTPVLVGDVRTGAVSAIHAGWRGTAARIVAVAIATLEAQGSQRADLRFALGPAIAGEVYQVTRAVAATVAKTVFTIPTDAASSLDANLNPLLSAVEIEEILATVGVYPEQSRSPILADPEPDKVRLDVRRGIVGQLEMLGIAPTAIAIAPHCTYQDPDRFFSYRRTGEKFVQWSGIVSGSISSTVSEA